MSMSLVQIMCVFRLITNYFYNLWTTNYNKTMQTLFAWFGTLFQILGNNIIVPDSWKDHVTEIIAGYRVWAFRKTIEDHWVYVEFLM